jgi:hypothetical protein
MAAMLTSQLKHCQVRVDVCEFRFVREALAIVATAHLQLCAYNPGQTNAPSVDTPTCDCMYVKHRNACGGSRMTNVEVLNSCNEVDRAVLEVVTVTNRCRGGVLFVQWSSNSVALPPPQ